MKHRFLLCSLLMLPLAHQAQAVDIVARKSDEKTLRGKITKAGPTAIVLTRTNGDEETIPVDDLKSIQFEGEPGELRQARSNTRNGAFDSALEKLKKAKATTGSGNRRIRSEVDFTIAMVLARQALNDSAKVTEALDALRKFRVANKVNFRYFEATLLHASVLSAAGDTAEARGLLTEVENSGVDSYQWQAGVESGRILLNDGDTASALAAFDKVVDASRSSTSPVLYDGLLGRATCQLKQNRPDQAIQTLQEVISSAPPSESQVLARAWLQKGDCHRQKSETKAALMAYLSVDVLYAGEGIQHAEALLRLSELWGPSGHQDRAVDAGARLAEKYPNSTWARQATGG